MRNPMGFLKKKIKKTRNAAKYVNDIRRGWARVTYAQEAEDIILLSLFGDKQNGFYVDVGAHHPRRFSNTYLLYRRGWSGINIDPAPGCMSLFSKMRPRDTNLEIGIAREVGIRQLFVFDNSPLNTFDPALAHQRQEDGWHLLHVKQIQMKPLRIVLAEYCHGPIDLLSIDVEGLDLEVLESNDWAADRPRFICVEALQRDGDPTGPFLVSQGYRLLTTTGRSRIYEQTAPRGWGQS